MLEINRTAMGRSSYGISEKNDPKKSVNQQGEASAEETVVKKQDQLVRGTTTTPVTYSKPKQVSAEELQQLNQQRMDSFNQMLRSMVVQQGEQYNLTLFGLNLNVTPEDSQNAAAAIAPGGEYSVDAVAGRILDMAKALAGGDESKIAELREAVEKGFEAAGVELGGELPGICQETYNEVMKGFDEWEASFE